MASYILTGESDSFQFTELEYLVLKLMNMTPTVKVVIIPKHTNEWPDYQAKLKRVLGYKENISPMVFSGNGYVFNSIDEFKNHIVWRYGVAMGQLDADQVKNRTK